MSFPVIGELKGEWSATFYEFRLKLDSAVTRDALGALEATLAAEEERLAETESRKLRLLIARRWKTLR